MYFRNRSFTWWHNRMMLALAGSMMLAALVLVAGGVLASHYPSLGAANANGPDCYFRHAPNGAIECARFFGSGLAGVLLTRGFYLTNIGFPLAAFMQLGIEFIAAIPLAWLLARVLRDSEAAAGTGQTPARKRGFTWWYARLTLALVVSMAITALLLQWGAFTVPRPSGSVIGPLCFRDGWLIPSIVCANFSGADIASYVLSRGYTLLHLRMLPLALYLLALECLAMAPLAWVLGKKAKNN